MELEIPIACGSKVREGCQSSPTLPGWPKAGKRTRGTRAHHQGLLTTSEDEARDLSIIESDEFVTDNLPPKKRKLLDSDLVIGGNDVSARNGKDLCCRERKQHTCNICSRSFSSYQALGGHKAHHNGLKDQKVTPAAEEGGAAADALVECGGGAVHRCTYCYKVFSKGQALGGHRRHCQRPITENRQEMFKFDLNKLPPDWLES